MQNKWKDESLKGYKNMLKKLEAFDLKDPQEKKNQEECKKLITQYKALIPDLTTNRNQFPETEQHKIQQITQTCNKIITKYDNLDNPPSSTLLKICQILSKNVQSLQKIKEEYIASQPTVTKDNEIVADTHDADTNNKPLGEDAQATTQDFKELMEKIAEL